MSRIKQGPLTLPEKLAGKATVVSPLLYVLRISFLHKLDPLEGDRPDQCLALRIAFLYLDLGIML